MTSVLPSTPQAQEIQTLFNRIAPAYDRLNDWLSLGQHRIWKQMAVKWSGAAVGAVCLDLCCGSGDLSRLLARQVGITGQVYGVDFSAAQLAIAKQRAEQSVQPLAITWVEADALNLPFGANQFDAATMGYGLRNVLDIPRSLNELHRVLKPGAKAAILDFHRPVNPAMWAFQQWYLDTIVVPAAESLGLKEEYIYISPSLDRFPSGTEQVDLARQAGFVNVTHYPIAGGMMGVLVAQKPS
ncbi:bifunctional demethylmenaquinone methyltransferase/2-methoxy-6-polyprenyl-1,4-benzoquinol methylase UbiE [Leptolyngbya sp. NK1-12]|uniref:2-phytyl-1,4-naphtoquinone methyltransferase n=1 Tax=Leptolyngbya sp. NK1-12 TaxID=2547451 RepID=A0AA96WGL9_9CYAN|nr:bifunctional demethylmenaquinone methyltransferase/2-methoxy-6-polyprenyl-1,4-benzoquinol methylase UbiE [Leptolyngbya sp. NK1-12]WNZ24883.1 bifunctional demethylmenaquinone methyltransferase/2-methoxy-6-polyprenyl-1,4-benzoquinol methylase UbiE [Leptolyngbya sp. NK1-12]